jgi:glucose uptake protein
MFVPGTFAIALLMTVLSTICWGSFANTLKVTKNYRSELYYWDYAAGIFLISLVLAFTMGTIPGGKDTFLNNLHDATRSNLLYAAIGGFIFNIANVLLISGIEIVGLAIAFPIAIGIALVEGVVLSYAVQPKGSAMLLGSGVAMAVLAVILVGKAYGALQTEARAVSRRGIIICVVSGLLMGTFAPFVTRAMTSGVPLTPYTVAVFFTLGAVICCFVFNTILMKRPLVGEPVGFDAYRAAPASYHLLGLLGGAIWGVGTLGRRNGFQFCCGKPGGRGDLLCDWPGLANGGRRLGRVFLARIPGCEFQGEGISGGNVRCICPRPGTDRPRLPDVLAGNYDRLGRAGVDGQLSAGRHRRRESLLRRADSKRHDSKEARLSLTALSCCFLGSSQRNSGSINRAKRRHGNRNVARISPVGALVHFGDRAANRCSGGNENVAEFRVVGYDVKHHPISLLCGFAGHGAVERDHNWGSSGNHYRHDCA